MISTLNCEAKELNIEPSLNGISLFKLSADISILDCSISISLFLIDSIKEFLLS
nr:MAG TPA: hypothetical protein [Caudoviricetes sp.]